jgi:hypothetical protein
MPVPSGAARSIFCYNRPVELTLSQLYGLNPYNPVILLLAVIVLAVFGLLATLVPALRASSISPPRGPANRMSSVAFFSIAAWLHSSGSTLNPIGPSHKAAARFGSSSHSLLCAPRK